MFISTGVFLAGLFGKHVSVKAAKAIGIGTFIVAAIAAFLIGKAIYDANVIDDYQDKRDAEIAKGVVNADREATRKQDQRDLAFRESQDGIKAAAENAVAADPEKGKRPVGPASQSYYDELRRQQRENKGQ